MSAIIRSSLESAVLHLLLQNVVLVADASQLDIMYSIVFLAHLFYETIELGVANLGFPSRWSTRGKHLLDFLQRLLARFRIGEVELNSAKNAHDAKDDKHPPGDVDESGRNVETQSKVEKPVAESRDTHTSGAGLQTPNLCGVYPGYRSQSQSVNDDKEVAECNDGGGLGTGNLNQDVGVSADAPRNIFTGRQHATHDEVANGHTKSPIDEERSTTGPIHVEKHDRGENDEEGILNTGGNQVDVAGETGHGENVDDILHSQ